MVTIYAAIVQACFFYTRFARLVPQRQLSGFQHCDRSSLAVVLAAKPEPFRPTNASLVRASETIQTLQQQLNFKRQTSHI
jgi:hypothetical protein